MLTTAIPGYSVALPYVAYAVPQQQPSFMWATYQSFTNMLCENDVGLCEILVKYADDYNHYQLN